MSKDATQTSTIRPDAQTGAFQDVFRKLILGSLGGLTGNTALQGMAGPYASGFGLPNTQALKDAASANFAQQRGQATMAANDLATKAGAFGGDRAALLQSQMLGDVNRNEASTLAGIDYQGQQDSYQRLMGLLGLAGQGASMGGYSQSMSMPSNPWGSVLGLGALAGGLGWAPFAAKAAGSV